MLCCFCLAEQPEQRRCPLLPSRFGIAQFTRCIAWNSPESAGLLDTHNGPSLRHFSAFVQRPEARTRSRCKNLVPSRTKRLQRPKEYVRGRLQRHCRRCASAPKKLRAPALTCLYTPLVC